MKNKPEEIVSILREEIQGYDTRVRREETGTVLEVGDGIATVYGLDRAVYGELVELDTGVKGMVMDLARDSVGVVLLGSEAGIREGTVVRRTGHAADVPVGDGLIGRVVDVLGRPIDGLGPIRTTETRPIEHEASVSKINEEQLFYLMSRGLSKEEATQMIVMGFIEPFSRELPMEYAVELNQLIKLDMSGSIG